MKKVFEKVIVCCVILFLIFVVVLANRVVMPKYINENQDGRITGEYYREKLNTDILFVGSSIVYSGISPCELYKEYGFTSFDRANSSQPLWISYYMIKDAIKRNKPQLVVLDVNFIKCDEFYAEEPSTRKALDGMKWSKEKVDCIKESISDEENFIDYVVPAFRFHGRWKELSSDDFKYVFYNKPVSHNGQIINTDTSKEFYGIVEYSYDSDASINDRNKWYLGKIITLCNENDVKLMLIKIPSNNGNWSENYDVQINEIASGSNVTYINYDKLYSDIGIDYLSDSPDEGSHLNSYGAKKLTKYIGEYIMNNYNVTCHKDDEEYEKIWLKKIEDYDNAF